MTAAMQLHKDACLMNTNLDILDQYALALHGTASKILQQTIGGNPYPKAEVAAAAQGPRVRRASVHMEALGLWRPSMDPMQFDTRICVQLGMSTSFDNTSSWCLCRVNTALQRDLLRLNSFNISSFPYARYG